MTGTARPPQAARGHLVRLAVVVAVLAGLALVIGVQCADGMSTAMPMAHSANAALASGDHEVTMTSVVPVAHGVIVAADEGSPGDGGMGGALAACLMFIIAVVALIAGLRLTEWRRAGVASLSARMAMMPVARLRAPSLAELCLLRI